MAQIPTMEDFSVLRREILENLNELKLIISSPERSSLEKRWLRSSDVKQLLSISHGTLQKMRNLGQIPCRKIDGVILYDRVEIERMINGIER